MARLYDRVQAEGYTAVIDGLPMWLEFRAPQVISSEISGTLRWEDVRPERSWGWLITEISPTAGMIEAASDGARAFCMALFVRYPNRPSRHAFQYEPGAVTGPTAYLVTVVNPDGTIQQNPLAQSNRTNHTAWAGYATGVTEIDKPILDGAAVLLDVAWLALSFMHCKNVERREATQPRGARRSWERKHGRPLVRYHILDIDPMKKTLESEGGASTHGLKKALHICRGHFAHYPDGLFNRGEPETVWRPQHVRGSASEGAVVKDYNVKAPPTPGEG